MLELIEEFVSHFLTQIAHLGQNIGCRVEGSERGCKKDCVNVVLEENEGERNEVRREKV